MNNDLIVIRFRRDGTLGRMLLFPQGGCELERFVEPMGFVAWTDDLPSEAVLSSLVRSVRDRLTVEVSKEEADTIDGGQGAPITLVASILFLYPALKRWTPAQICRCLNRLDKDYASTPLPQSDVDRNPEHHREWCAWAVRHARDRKQKRRSQRQEHCHDPGTA